MKNAVLLTSILWGLSRATSAPLELSGNVTNLLTPAPRDDIPLAGRIIALCIGIVVCALGIIAIAWQYRKKPRISRDAEFRASIMQYITEKDILMMNNPQTRDEPVNKSALKESSLQQKDAEEERSFEEEAPPQYVGKRRNSKPRVLYDDGEELRSPALSTPSDGNQRQRLLSISDTRSSPNNPLLQSGSERFDVISDGYRQSPVAQSTSPHFPGQDLHLANERFQKHEPPEFQPNGIRNNKHGKKDKKEKREKRKDKRRSLSQNSIEEFKNEWSAAQVEDGIVERKLVPPAVNRRSLDSLNSPSSKKSGCWSTECSFCGKAATMMCTDCGIICSNCNTSRHPHSSHHVVVPLEGGNDASTSNESSRGKHSKKSPSSHYLAPSRVGNHSFDQSLATYPKSHRRSGGSLSPPPVRESRKQRKDDRSIASCNSCTDLPTYQCSTCELFFCNSSNCRFSPCVVQGFPHNLVSLCKSCRSRVAPSGNTCSSCSQKLPGMGRGSNGTRMFSQVTY